ncbi:MAG: T9SS-dependent M36 family metallopeptidase [Bacteroidota bacterium]
MHIKLSSLSTFLILIFYLFSSSLFAQNTQDAIDFFEDNLSEFNATSDAEWIITDAYMDDHTGLYHVYMNQSYRGILFDNHIANIHVNTSDEVAHYAGKFMPRFSRTISNSERVDMYDAVRTVFQDLNVSFAESENATYVGGAAKEWKLEYGDHTLEPITAKLCYTMTADNRVKLAWSVDFYSKSGDHWWQYRIDAANAQVLSKKDFVITCNFGVPHTADDCKSLHHNHAPVVRSAVNARSKSSAMMGAEYNVYPLTVESPNHGDRSIVVDPADPIASPFGWHDTNGAAGAEFTITQGNNVLAQEDENGNNGNGFRPDGGAALSFDFPIDFSQAPTNNRSAALTNLFYWNNIMHDLTYQYGFTEAAGNFQENNYGKGGAGSDFVFADGLDGAGTNNANFSTPPDGGNPRMQMFLWNGVGTITVNSPSNIAGTYQMTPASFGADNYTLTGDIVLAEDGSAEPNQVCNPPITNGSAVSGNIAMIDRGGCEFGAKALAAQNAGATGVIICNNVPGGGRLSMGPGDDGGSVNIPAIMLSFEDCATLKAELPGVNVTFSDDVNQLDGDYDNGIIAHEYGHGISIRLTGGPNTSGCLSGAEQMGEGWSDFWGLVTAVRAGDDRNTRRGIGTYAQSQPTTGQGIRSFPYSYDMSINPHTYDDIKTEAIPHGVGSVWCAMLWDMFWDLVDVHGYDTDLYNGTGGNNIAIDLVLNGMKMQTCNPGFVDGRDAILAADDALYGGANKCTIWNAFARRGLGFSANQGGSASNTDGTEAFDLPTSCGSGCTPGAACDDGDDCTTGDAFDANCNCAGTVVDADNDGVCAADDPNDSDPCVPNSNVPNCNPGGGDCVTIDSNDFEAGFGIWNLGGADARRNRNDGAFANSGTYCIRLRDNSGAESSMFTDNIDASAYNQLEVSFSYIVESFENVEDFFLEISTNGGSSYTIVEDWILGTDFQNDERKNELVLINTSLTSTTRVRFRSDAGANNDRVYIDDVVIKGCGGNTGGCTPGSACDDGDDCTTGDVFDANCNCAGTVVDADNDGVCAADDPDDNDPCVPDNSDPSCGGSCTPGSACDDGDACTINDVFDANCNCAGTFTDADNDGVCVGDDPDDNDECVPNATSPNCNTGGDCDAPTGLVATAISKKRATLNWNAVADANDYDVQYRELGTSTWTDRTTSDTDIRITGLRNRRTYEWRVRTNCSSGTSDWSVTCEFTAGTSSSGGCEAGLIGGQNNDLIFNTLRAYPNPTNSELNVQLNLSAEGNLRLIDMVGRTVFEVAVRDGRSSQTINVSDLPSGVYFLELRSEGAVQVEKIVVE